MSTVSEEDDNFGTEEAHQAIVRCLGTERRHRVLAGLYMGRYVTTAGSQSGRPPGLGPGGSIGLHYYVERPSCCMTVALQGVIQERGKGGVPPPLLIYLFYDCSRSDVSLMVRQAALHVWKIVVTNTARSLREILPTLITLLLGCLASESPDKRKVAARTLGDLVRKLGERVLPEIIPMLEGGLVSPETQQRQGVCIGLSEIIQHTSRDNILLYVDSLLPTVRNALCDKEKEVRAAAAQTFDSLHTTVGKYLGFIWGGGVFAPLARTSHTPLGT